MRRVFAVLTSALTLLVVAQFFLAAMGAFDTAPKDESFGPHRALGYIIGVFALAVVVVAALARTPKRFIWMPALITGLALLQGVIAAVANAVSDDGAASTAGRLVFGLHAVNGLMIMGLSGNLARRARTFANEAAPSVTTKGPATTERPATMERPATTEHPTTVEQPSA